MDPVHQDTVDGQWYFYDETFADRLGPFPSEEDARIELERYAEWLDKGTNMTHAKAQLKTILLEMAEASLLEMAEQDDGVVTTQAAIKDHADTYLDLQVRELMEML